MIAGLSGSATLTYETRRPRKQSPKGRCGGQTAYSAEPTALHPPPVLLAEPARDVTNSWHFAVRRADSPVSVRVPVSVRHPQFGKFSGAQRPGGLVVAAVTWVDKRFAESCPHPYTPRRYE